ncbi:MAG TPA: PQQ-binding-like beta-propeller repeat protein [Bryobacteraceae bacterium]|nr:PQQ-binding-like beta-propeller repeat protein [Bryobacteraceae bacterium]
MVKSIGAFASSAGLFLVLTFVTSGAQASEHEWRQFRGPESNPVSSNRRLPEKWSKTQNVEWSVPIPGRGWSSPIVTGGKIFVTTVVTDGTSKKPQIGTEYSNQYMAELLKQGLSQEQAMERVAERDLEWPHQVMLHYFLYCVEEKTGSVLWKKEFYSGRPPGGRHRKNSFASETPVTDGKLVYVHISNLGLYAFNLKGRKVWERSLEPHPIYLNFGTGSSPILNDDQLLIVNDNQRQQFIAAFDKKTGETIWRTSRNIGDKAEQAPRSGWSTPYVWSHGMRTEIVTIGPGDAVSYDLKGRELWRLAGPSAVSVPSPFAYDGLLYIDGGKSRPLFAVRAGASGDISLGKSDQSNEFVVWSAPRGGTYLPTPVAYEDGLYALTETGILTRYDTKTGKVNYKERLDREAGAFTSSPWAYNGRIFCLSEEGKTYVVSAGDKFRLIHVNSLDEMAQATPAIVNDRLLIRTESRLYSIRSN